MTKLLNGVHSVAVAIATLNNVVQLLKVYVTRHEKIGLMCTQNLNAFLDFKLE